jgi:hypothetical protein
MKVSDLVDSYVSYRQLLGMRYRTQADFLKSFVRAAGDIDIRDNTGPPYRKGKGDC